MKKIFLILLSFFALYTKAQVKFTLENVKNKSANVVYIGEPNTFKINASQEISVTNITPSQGNVRMNTDGSFSLYVHEVSDRPVELKYTQTKNGVESEVIYPTKYLVKKMPDLYQLKIGDFTSGGLVSSEKLRKNHKVSLQSEGHNLDLKNVEVKCTILYQPLQKDPVEVSYHSKDVESTKYYNSILNNLQEGDKLFFEQIRIINEAGAIIELTNLNFKLVK